MKILNFLDEIANKVSRFNVLHTLDAEITYLEEQLIPSLEKVMRTYPGKVETSYAPLIAISGDLGRMKPGAGFAPLLATLKAYHKQATLIAKYSRDTLGDESILKDALTYRVVTVLQYVDTLSFVSKYTTRLIDGFLYNEQYRANKEHIGKPSAYHVNMTEWMIRNRYNYLHSLKVGNMKEKEVEEGLAGIPDKVINKSTYELDVTTAEFGVSSLDPLNFGIISGKNSIIFLIRDMFERARNNINESRKSDIKSIELRLVYLKEAKRNIKDPNLEEKIKDLDKRQKALFLKTQEYDRELD